MAKGKKKKGGSAKRARGEVKAPHSSSGKRSISVADIVDQADNSSENPARQTAPVEEAPRPFPLTGYAIILGIFAIVLAIGLVPFQIMKQYKADDHVVYFLYVLILLFVAIAAAYDRIFDMVAAYNAKNSSPDKE